MEHLVNSLYQMLDFTETGNVHLNLLGNADQMLMS